MLGTGDSGAKAERTAILVIHGVGQQNPYETLDSFAGGLARYFRKERSATFEIRPERIAHKDWTEVAIHFDFQQPVGPRGLKLLSLYEYYWAPYTEDKISYLGSLRWLIQTGLTPLRFMSANLQVRLGGYMKRTKKENFWILLQEIFRAALIFIPLVILLAAGLFWLPQAGKLTEIPRYGRELLGTAAWYWLLAFTVCAGMVLVMLLALLRSRQKPIESRAESIQQASEQKWRQYAVVCLTVFLLGAVAILWRQDGLRDLLQRRLTEGRTWILLGTACLVYVARKILVNYIGDVAVYVSADRKSKGYEARKNILDGSTEALKRLLGERTRNNYDQVIVAGHSLGSVIAYDTINEVVAQVWANDDPLGQGPEKRIAIADLAKLRGLVTFGSPLDKIYYFFREQVSDRQAYRAQILSFLHSFRKVRSGRTYGEDEFKYRQGNGPDERPSTFPQLAGFTWLNVYSPMDPVSGYLNFYQMGTGTQLRLWYRIPLAAHLKYWGDPEFYKFFGNRML